MQDTDIPAETEVLHAHLLIARGLRGIADRDTRVDVLLQRRLDGEPFGMCRPGLFQRGLPSTSFARSFATGTWKKRANSNTVVSSWFQQT